MKEFETLVATARGPEELQAVIQTMLDQCVSRGAIAFDHTITAVGQRLVVSIIMQFKKK